MDSAERRDSVQDLAGRRTEAEVKAEARLAKRAEALRANLKRRKSQARARAEAEHEPSPEDTGAARSAD